MIHGGTELAPGRARPGLISGSGGDRHRLRGFALGPNSYIQEPTNYAVLEDAVRHLCLRLVVSSPAPLIMGDSS